MTGSNPLGTGPTFDERDRENRTAAETLRRLADALEQSLRSELSDGGGILVDHGDRWPQRGGHGEVTEADQGQTVALKALQSDGTYGKILDKWGIQSGANNSPVINGAAG